MELKHSWRNFNWKYLSPHSAFTESILTDWGHSSFWPFSSGNKPASSGTEGKSKLRIIQDPHHRRFGNSVDLHTALEHFAQNGWVDTDLRSLLMLQCSMLYDYKWLTIYDLNKYIKILNLGKCLLHVGISKPKWHFAQCKNVKYFLPSHSMLFPPLCQ